MNILTRGWDERESDNYTDNKAKSTDSTFICLGQISDQRMVYLISSLTKCDLPCVFRVNGSKQT